MPPRSPHACSPEPMRLSSGLGTDAQAAPVLADSSVRSQYSPGKGPPLTLYSPRQTAIQQPSTLPPLGDKPSTPTGRRMRDYKELSQQLAVDSRTGVCVGE